MAVLPPVCSDPAGAREEGDAEPLRTQDDSRVRGVYASADHPGGDCQGDRGAQRLKCGVILN